MVEIEGEDVLGEGSFDLTRGIFGQARQIGEAGGAGQFGLPFFGRSRRGGMSGVYGGQGMHGHRGHACDLYFCWIDRRHDRPKAKQLSASGQCAGLSSQVMANYCRAHGALVQITCLNNQRWWERVVVRERWKWSAYVCTLEVKDSKNKIMVSTRNEDVRSQCQWGNERLETKMRLDVGVHEEMMRLAARLKSAGMMSLENAGLVGGSGSRGAPPRHPATSTVHLTPSA